jgi:hypothetical protein
LRCSCGCTRGDRLCCRGSRLGLLRWRLRGSRRRRTRGWSRALLLRENCLQNISRLGDVRQVDLRLYAVGIGTCRAARSRALAIARALQSCADFVRFMVLK